MGFGPFARKVHHDLDGQASEIMVIGEDNHYLNRFKGTGVKVLALKGEIDSDSIDESLVRMEIVTEKAVKEKNGIAHRTKTVDIAIVDLEDLGKEMNNRAVEILRGFAECIVVSTRHEGEVSVLDRLGANIAVCPERDVAEIVVMRLYNEDIRDVITVLEEGDIREASVEIPEQWTGRHIKEIETMYGVRVLFITRAYPVVEKKKVVGNREVIVYPGDVEDDEGIAFESTDIASEDSGPEAESKIARFSGRDITARVIGPFNKIKKLSK